MAETRHLVLCGQSRTGVASLLLHLKDINGDLGGVLRCAADGDECAYWNRSRCADIEVPAGAVTACMFLLVTKDAAGGTFRAAFDNAKLVPTLIFADDFEETADTSLWSATVP